MVAVQTIKKKNLPCAFHNCENIVVLEYYSPDVGSRKLKDVVDALRQHYNTKHIGQQIPGDTKAPRCYICQRTYTYQAGLNRHITLKHETTGISDNRSTVALEDNRESLADTAVSTNKSVQQ